MEEVVNNPKPVEEVPAETIPEVAPEQGSHKKAWIISTLVIVVIIAAVLAYFFMSSGPADELENSLDEDQTISDQLITSGLNLEFASDAEPIPGVVKDLSFAEIEDSELVAQKNLADIPFGLEIEELFLDLEVPLKEKIDYTRRLMASENTYLVEFAATFFFYVEGGISTALQPDEQTAIDVLYEEYQKYMTWYFDIQCRDIIEDKEDATMLEECVNAFLSQQIF